jgi:molybdate transport system substrate-binding protein
MSWILQAGTPQAPLSTRYIQWYITVMRLISVSLLLLGLSLPAPAGASPLTVYAAASTIAVMRPIEDIWFQKTGKVLRIVHGSSGALARQISAGAPVDVFFSANAKWLDYLIGRKLAQTDTRKSVLVNRLALIVPAGTGRINIVDPATDIPKILTGNARLAIGDPRHVPAGQYAREALVSLGIWKTVRSKTARTRNVRLALALVQRGEAALGIVYRTDARHVPQVRILETLPKNLHSPIVYEAVLTSAAQPGAGKFLAFLTSDDALTLYRAAGFVVPE